jgi:hypothetical protein
MSLLMFSHETEGFVLLTDTYATTPEGDPRTFQSKVFVLPHLNMAMGGTGIGQLMRRWFDVIQSNMLVRDIETLDLHAPEALRKIWAGLIDEFDGLGRAVEEGATSTIYHFGFTEEAQPIRFTYRSASNFESEEATDPGFGIKPVPKWDFKSPGSLEDMVAVAVRLREQEDARPKTDRVHLGGDLIATFVGNGSIASNRVYRWSDFDQQWLAMSQLLTTER